MYVHFTVTEYYILYIYFLSLAFIFSFIFTSPSNWVQVLYIFCWWSALAICDTNAHSCSNFRIYRMEQNYMNRAASVQWKYFFVKFVLFLCVSVININVYSLFLGPEKSSYKDRFPCNPGFFWDRFHCINSTRV